MEQLIKRMLQDPMPKLDAAYNKCWRLQNNGINEKDAQDLMSVIQAVAAMRGYELTGHDGSYKFKEVSK